MRNSRLWITAAMILVLTVVVFSIRRHAAMPMAPAGAPTRAGDLPAPPSGSDRPASAGAISPNSAQPAAGTGEAYLEHTFRSFVVAQQAEIGLTDSQVNRLVSDLLETYEVQSELAGRFMAETEVRPDMVTVHVPPFPVEGKALRDLFYQRVKAEFPDKVERLTATLGGFIDDAFRGFGITDQAIVLKRTDAPDTFEVTWNATVAEGQTPSREPDGTTYGGSSGVMLFSRDQIESGEYRFLAPVLSRRFPPAAAPHPAGGPAK